MLTTFLLPATLAGLLPVTFLTAPTTPSTYREGAAATTSVLRRGGFARAVAVGNGEVLVGEPDNSMRPGVVYVYRKDAAGRWAEAARITAANAAVGDGFGAALDLDGNRLLVGAFNENAMANSSAFIFERDASGTWRQVARLSSPEGALGFGVSVALSGDLAAVGAPLDGGSMLTGGRGAVYVFRRSAGGEWTRAAQLTASDATGQTVLGVSIDLSGDDLLAASRGAGIYAFRRAGSDWQQTGTLTLEGRQPQDRFGASFVLTAGGVLVGAPGSADGTGRVFRFRRDAATGRWVQDGQLTAPDSTVRQAFGSRLATDGRTLLVGAGRAETGGAVFALHPDARGEWVDATRIQPPGLARDDEFGGALAVNGTVAAAGLTGADFGAGKAMILEGASWMPVATVVSEAEALEAVTGSETRCVAGTANRFSCGQVDLLAFLPIQQIGGGRGVHLNDIWGWTDPQGSKEYALVGRIDGTSFVDISDPIRPVYVGQLPMTEGATANAWRDIKVYRDHAFIVADGAGEHGMQVFDLAKLRQYRGTPITFKADTTYHRIASAHNIVINEESGFAYAVGSNSGGETCGGGLHMVDIREPKNPKFAGCFSDPQTGMANTGYTHDAQCVMYKGPDRDYQGREICIGSNETAISVADVTDKASPKAIARAPYPNVGYTHQGWFTDDQHYFLVDDELDEMNGAVKRTRTLVWDMKDLDDPQLVKEYMGETEASDHNLYVKGNLVYESNYAAGLRILDISNPLNPVEVGHFDVQPFGDNKPAFTGSWSNYPYFKSGVIIVTGIEQGLFLVRYRPTRPVS